MHAFRFQKSFSLLAAALVVALPLVGCNSDKADGKTATQVAAKVNGAEILSTRSTLYWPRPLVSLTKMLIERARKSSTVWSISKLPLNKHLPRSSTATPKC